MPAPTPLGRLAQPWQRTARRDESDSRTLGFGHPLPEAAVTLGSHHLLLRGVPRNPGLAVHAVLDKTRANLTLARLQILRLDALFDEPPAAPAAPRCGRARGRAP